MFFKHHRKICSRTNNKKLDKLIGLVHYALSSADKAIKFVNISNFEAEFAVKLFKSDKDTLLSELQTLTPEQLLTSSNSTRGLSNIDMAKAISHKITAQNHNTDGLTSHDAYLMALADNSNLKQTIVHLQNEVARLKEDKGLISSQLNNIKQVLASQDRKDKARIRDKEKEIGNLLKQIHDMDDQKKLADKTGALKLQGEFKQRQIEKYLQLMQEVLGASVGLGLKKYQQVVEKETKFGIMLHGSAENPRKKQEIELILRNLSQQRESILSDIIKKGQQARQAQDARLVQPTPIQTQIHNYIRNKLLPGVKTSLHHVEGMQNLSDIDILQLYIMRLEQQNQQQQPTYQHHRPQANSPSRADKEIAELRNRNSQLQDEVDSLVADLGHQEQTIKEAEQLKAQVEQLYQHLTIVCTKHNLTLKELEGAPAHDFGSLIEAIDSGLTQALVQGQAPLSSRNTQNNQAVKRLENELSNVREWADTQLKQYRSHTEYLEEECSRLQKSVSQLQENLRKAKKQAKDQEMKLEKKERREKELQEILAQSKKSNQFLRVQNDKLKQSNNTLQQDLIAENQAKRNSLRSEGVSQVAQLQKDLKVKTESTRLLEEQKQSLGQHVQELQIEIARLKQQNLQNNNEKQLSDLRIKLTEKTEECFRLEKQVEKQQQKCVDLQTELEEFIVSKQQQVDQEYVERIQKQLHLSNQQLKNTKFSLKALQQENEQLRQDLEMATSQEKQLKQSVEAMKQKLAENQEQIKRAGQKQEHTQLEFAQLNQVVNDLKQKLLSSEQQHASQVESLQQLLTQQSEKIASLEAADREKARAALALQVNLSQLTAQKNTVETQIQGYKSQITDLQSQINLHQTKATTYYQQLLSAQKQLSQTQAQLKIKLGIILVDRQTQSQDSGNNRNVEGLIANYVQEIEKDRTISRMKETNHVNIVKVILRKVLTELDSDLESQTDLDRLLQLGTRRVFEWRRNYLMHSDEKPPLKTQQPIRQSQLRPISDFDSEASASKNIPSSLQPNPYKESEPNNPQPQQQADIAEFSDYKDQSQNASMMSVEDYNQERVNDNPQNGLEDFADVKSQQLEQSLVVPDNFDTIQNTENKIPHKEGQEQDGFGFVDFADDLSKALDSSMLSYTDPAGQVDHFNQDEFEQLASSNFADQQTGGDLDQYL